MRTNIAALLCGAAGLAAASGVAACGEDDGEVRIQSGAETTGTGTTGTTGTTSTTGTTTSP